jgi:hypothetical protein
MKFQVSSKLMKLFAEKKVLFVPQEFFFPFQFLFVGNVFKWLPGQLQLNFVGFEKKYK